MRVWTRLNARGGPTELHFVRARELMERVVLIELSSEVLSRALRPFPLALRTLDALHLATVDYLRRGAETVELASYDKRLVEAAKALGIPVADI
jgi:predicted nucleic acid-binding protein